MAVIVPPFVTEMFQQLPPDLRLESAVVESTPVPVTTSVFVVSTLPLQRPVTVSFVVVTFPPVTSMVECAPRSSPFTSWPLTYSSPPWTSSRGLDSIGKFV